jgi:hypothetical protein
MTRSSTSLRQVHLIFHEGVTRVLSRLSHVRKRAADQWSARCPAHDDRGPSLSIKELPDGRLLLHCFAGCSVTQIIAALGLDLKDLFPERTECQGPMKRRRLLTASQALELLNAESLIVSMVAHDIGIRGRLVKEDVARVAKAYGRISALRDEVYQ